MLFNNLLKSFISFVKEYAHMVKQEQILLSITGGRRIDWQRKIVELRDFKIKKAALFVTRYEKHERLELYSALLGTGIKITFCHIRGDVSEEELQFLINEFECRHFNIHEAGFKFLKKWKGDFKHLYLEMNYDNHVNSNVDVNRIGGFCIDLSHFMAGKERKTKDYEYIMKRKDVHRYFKFNHLNGYSYCKKKDLHTIRSLKDFDYLKEIPKFLFGRYIALEVNNSIKEQIKFRDYILKLLK